MIDRRTLLASAVAVLAAPAVLLTAGSRAAQAETNAAGQTVVRMPREYLPHEVGINAEFAAGEIHIVNATHNLYWTLGNGRAIQYTTAVGDAGRNFSGMAIVQRKAEWPAWVPTANMIRLEPAVYGPYAGGLPGGHERNPLGARALYLYQNGRDTMYRIHGTPQPWTIGQSFSSGCIRLMNDHAIDLYDRVPVGTRVFVT